MLGLCNGQPITRYDHDLIGITHHHRSQPLIGAINVWGFEYAGNNVWDDGNIYDPKSGNIYSCTIKMTGPNTIDVRGYIGISLIGRSDTWTRQVAK